jgi:broad specificity phosphatase PhoE
MGVPCEVFNVGNYRRKQVTGTQDHTFFDQKNQSANKLRTQLAMDVLEELIHWLQNGGGHVGIHDATNTTRARREQILARIAQEPNMGVLFVESICRKEDILAQNIALKLQSPDYKNSAPIEALEDFRARLASYEEVYEGLDEKVDRPLSYVQLIDIGERVIANAIHGYLPSQIVFYLMNYHTCPRRIWLTRHGESTDNVLGRIGGDAELSSRGFDFAEELSDFMLSPQGSPKFKVWSSCLLRAVESVGPIISACRKMGDKSPLLKAHRIRALNELYAGSCEGMTYQQIKTLLPDEFKAREKNKLHYRYPNGGESYVDLIERLKPLIIELERETSDVLVVAHNAVVRTIIGYFMDTSSEDLPFLEVPLHQLICLTPTPFGCEVKHFNLDIQLGNSLEDRS